MTHKANQINQPNININTSIKFILKELTYNKYFKSINKTTSNSLDFFIIIFITLFFIKIAVTEAKVNSPTLVVALLMTICLIQEYGKVMMGFDRSMLEYLIKTNTKSEILQPNHPHPSLLQ